MEKNPLNQLAIKSLYIYKKTLAIYMGGRCRFYPTCSDYAVQAYQQRNFIYASILTIKRLIKCQPLGPHGVDMLPNKGKPYGK